LLFTQGLFGETILNFLDRLGVLPIVYTYSHDSSRTKTSKQFLREGYPYRYINERSYNPELIEVHPDDLIICADWTKDFFHINNLPSQSVYHIHPSLLPLYRGYGAVSEQLLRGVSIGGVSLYRDNGVIDGGDILYQSKITIDLNDSASDYIAKCAELAASWIAELAAGTTPEATPQDETLATHVQRTRQKSGFIDLNMGALYVHNTIRAYSYPYFGAFFYHNGKKINVWRSICESWAGVQGEPGEILSKGNHGVEIACGEGSIIITHAQIDGVVYEYDEINL
ncbi:MAG: formyl transferase, partial [Deferribacteraceae bacterium]|nr:formyl transferase [Deferribacteraceae bacterium]